MALALVTAATSEPVTVDEMREHLRLDGDDDDAYVSDCITAARTWVEGQTKRGILTQTWDYYIDYAWPYYCGSHRINLPLNPVQAISASSPEIFQITYVDDDGATQTLAQSQYTLVDRLHGSYIVPAYNIEWPTVRYVPEAIKVRFVVGESTAPADLKRAIMVLAGHYYEMRETGAGAPRAVEAMISPYRGVSF